MRCQKCNEPVLAFHSGRSAKLCAVHAWEIIGQIRDPDCEHCGGEGDIFTHATNCKNPLCAVAGGPHDCAGQVIECGCSIFDKVVE